MARGALWMVFGKVVDRSLGLVSTLVLARLLVPADFGLIAMASSLTALLELIGAFGTDLTLIRRQDAAADQYNTAWTLNLLTGVAVAILMVVFAVPMSAFYGEPRLTGVICVLALASALQGLENVGVVAFRKELRFGRDFTLQVLRKSMGFVITIPLAFVLRNYWALVLGVVGAQAGGVVLSYVMHPLRPRLSFVAFHEFFHFSKWVLMVNLFSVLYNRSSDFVVGRLMGVHPLGVFNMANELASMPGTELVAPVNRAVLPVYARVAHDHAALRREYLFVFGMVSLLAVPAVAGLAAVSPLVIRVLLGPKWQDASAVLSILAFYGLSRVLGSNAYTACVALGRLKDWFRITVLHVVLLVPLLILLTRSHGLIGAAIAYVVAAMVVLPVSIGITLRVLRIHTTEMRAILWRPVVASVATYACVRAAMGMMGVAHETEIRPGRAMVALGLMVLLGLVTYIASVWLTWWMAGRPEGAERAAVRKALAELERLMPSVRWARG